MLRLMIVARRYEILFTIYSTRYDYILLLLLMGATVVRRSVSQISRKEHNLPHEH